MMTDTEATALELLVDSYGLARVIDKLIDVCQLNAEHLEGNWQDYDAALRWAQCATALDCAARSIRLNIGE